MKYGFVTFSMQFVRKRCAFPAYNPSTDTNHQGYQLLIRNNSALKLLNHADPRLNDSEEKNWDEAKILRRTTTGQLSILVHFPAFHDQNFKNGFNLIK